MVFPLERDRVCDVEESGFDSTSAAGFDFILREVRAENRRVLFALSLIDDLLKTLSFGIRPRLNPDFIDNEESDGRNFVQQIGDGRIERSDGVDVVEKVRRGHVEASPPLIRDRTDDGGRDVRLPSAVVPHEEESDVGVVILADTFHEVVGEALADGEHPTLFRRRRFVVVERGIREALIDGDDPLQRCDRRKGFDPQVFDSVFFPLAFFLDPKAFRADRLRIFGLVLIGSPKGDLDSLLSVNRAIEFEGDGFVLGRPRDERSKPHHAFVFFVVLSCVFSHNKSHIRFSFAVPA